MAIGSAGPLFPRFLYPMGTVLAKEFSLTVMCVSHLSKRSSELKQNGTPIGLFVYIFVPEGVVFHKD